MPPTIHGTRSSRRHQHPVFDLRYWEGLYPLKPTDRGEGGWIDGPIELAKREQAIRLAKTKGRLGPSVPADVFVWADQTLDDKPWLTRLGGVPWREAGKRWPCDEHGVPLIFLGQICFADSRDILPCELPGDVALIFGKASRGWIGLPPRGHLEWSPLTLKTPASMSSIPWSGELPFSYQGVRHRTVQYTDHEIAEKAFKAVGYTEGGWNVHSVQATSIGTYASLPQGWPFEEGDGNTLIATLSSFYFRGDWPLCDIPQCLQRVDADGTRSSLWTDSARDFGVGDAGCIWIYRDKRGRFLLDDACG